MIPYGRQNISESDIQAVVDVLRSDFITQGPVVPNFEKAVSDYCSAKYAVAVNSATSALHLACLTLGVIEGDIVWTSPITFVASANCALYCGAQVDFVDIDPLTCNISVSALEAKLIIAKRENRIPKVLIPVHFAGQSCDMHSISILAQRYGFKVIEDASHAIGGKYRGEPIGNCRYSDITVFSFHPVKIITTGEGGMALTNNEQFSCRMQLLRSHGISKNEKLITHKSYGPWYYQQIDLGFNYRMTDIQAALGLSQMKRLDEFVSKRHEIAQCYDELLQELPINILKEHRDNYSALHLYVIRLRLDEIDKTHHEVFELLRNAGIGVNLHYIPVYRQPYYEHMGFSVGHCPEAEKYYGEAISLPIHPILSGVQIAQVVQALRDGVDK